MQKPVGHVQRDVLEMDQFRDDRIRDIIFTLSSEQNVDVLMAVESGSRAWGFASSDSDFDVRFIYREPIEDMTRLLQGKGVISKMTSFYEDGTGVPVDVVGWSLRKALQLGLGSNPQLAEWVTYAPSYVEEDGFRDELKTLTGQSSPRVLAHHYRGLARQVMQNYLKGPEVPIGKKYLYACRATLSAQYMIDNPHVGVCPPIHFEDLRQQVDITQKVYWEIEDLLDFKMSKTEISGRQRFPVIDRWLESMQERHIAAIPDLPDPFIPQDIAEKIQARHVSIEIEKLHDRPSLISQGLSL